MSKEVIEINAEYIATFTSFQDWVNRAARVLKSTGKYQQLVCVDGMSNVCLIGEDFMIARDNGHFPVKVYRLCRSVEFEF